MVPAREMAEAGGNLSHGLDHLIPSSRLHSVSLFWRGLMDSCSSLDLQVGEREAIERHGSMVFDSCNVARRVGGFAWAVGFTTREEESVDGDLDVGGIALPDGLSGDPR